MKKILAFVLAMAMCLCAAAALADAADYVGQWVTEDGSTIVYLLEDGTVYMTVGDQTQETTWVMDDSGNAQFMLAPASGVPMVINADGNVEIQADNMTLVLQPCNPFVGDWMTADKTTLVSLSMDGTVVMSMGDQTQETTWTMDDAGNAQFVLGPGSAVPMIINDDGNLEIQADNMTLVLEPVVLVAE